MFWPDPYDLRLTPDVWEAIGIDYRDEPTFEAGQIVVDKSRCWEALNVANWMNCGHADYYWHVGPREIQKGGGQGIYGDKDLFHLAWRYTDTPYSIIHRTYRGEHPAMVHIGPDGADLWVHRAGRKFVLDGEGSDFKTSRQHGPHYNPAIPVEEEAHAYLAELRQYVSSLNHQKIFAEIYAADTWNGGSGTGSGEAASKPYREVLQQILSTGRVRSVVDIGCGDWQVGRLIDWASIDYTGMDVVPDVIAANEARFNHRWMLADARNAELPDADLYILKDVLQHWTNAEIAAFMAKMRAGGREMLITNTVTQLGAHALNADLPSAGDFRPLDIRLDPFSVKAHELLHYTSTLGDDKTVLIVPGKVNVLRAIGGIMRALTGTGGATTKLVTSRAEICRACPDARSILAIIPQCSICTCALPAKIRNATEHCPKGFW